MRYPSRRSWLLYPGKNLGASPLASIPPYPLLDLNRRLRVFVLVPFYSYEHLKDLKDSYPDTPDTTLGNWLAPVLCVRLGGGTSTDD